MVEVKKSPKRLIRSSVKYNGPTTVALCSSDFVVPKVHVEVIYAFEKPTPGYSAALEEGLELILQDFREWAGRMSKDENGRPLIALNDDGVAWIDAEADVSLLSLMPFPPGHDLLEFVPKNRGAEELLLVQVTKFACGGMTLGIARHHQVADGEAAAGFVEAWTQAVKGMWKPKSPSHTRSLLNCRDPPKPAFEHIEYKKAPPKTVEPEQRQKEEYLPLSIKKLHFSAEMLKKLKTEAMKDLGGVGFYTTFESLTAFLWANVSKARGLAGEMKTKTTVACNGRKRLKPPIADDYFGNVIFHACAETTVKELTEKPLSYAAELVHNSIKRLDDAYMRSALDFVELQLKNPAPVGSGYRTVLSPNMSVTSWVQLGGYNIDFGWGTPVFFGPPLIPFEGLVMFIPSFTKDGSIDVSIALFAPDMAKLESIIAEL